MASVVVSSDVRFVSVHVAALATGAITAAVRVATTNTFIVEGRRLESVSDLDGGLRNE